MSIMLKKYYSLKRSDFMPKTIHSHYTTGAKNYDKREQDRNYFFEVQWMKDRIKESKKSRGKELLDIGCGTGTHLKYLQDEYNCTGFDLHQEMIDVAKKKLKKALNYSKQIWLVLI